MLEITGSEKLRESKALSHKIGAGNETRTRDLYLGKVSLYQLSYSRKKRSPHYRDIDNSVKKNAVVPPDAITHVSATVTDIPV